MINKLLISTENWLAAIDVHSFQHTQLVGCLSLADDLEAFFFVSACTCWIFQEV